MSAEVPRTDPRGSVPTLRYPCPREPRMQVRHESSPRCGPSRAPFGHLTPRIPNVQGHGAGSACCPGDGSASPGSLARWATPKETPRRRRCKWTAKEKPESERILPVLGGSGDPDMRLTGLLVDNLAGIRPHVRATRTETKKFDETRSTRPYDPNDGRLRRSRRIPPRASATPKAPASLGGSSRGMAPFWPTLVGYPCRQSPLRFRGGGEGEPASASAMARSAPCQSPMWPQWPALRGRPGQG